MSEPNCCNHDAAGRGSLLSSLLPAIACLFCPGCLTLWSSLLTVVGVQFDGIDEGTHAWTLAISVTFTLGTVIWRGLTARRWADAPAVVVGCGLLVTGHIGHREAVEWAGIVVLVGASLLNVWRHLRLRRLHAAH